jgi:hypothetical protein
MYGEKEETKKLACVALAPAAYPGSQSRFILDSSWSCAEQKIPGLRTRILGGLLESFIRYAASGALWVHNEINPSGTRMRFNSGSSDPASDVEKGAFIAEGAAAKVYK